MRRTITEFMLVFTCALLTGLLISPIHSVQAAGPVIVLANVPQAGFSGAYNSNFFDVGVRFSVPAGDDYALNSVSVQLVGVGATYQAYLYETPGALPGTLIAQIGGPVSVNATGAGVVTPFIAGTPITLQAGSTYLILLEGTGSYGLTANLPTGTFTFQGSALHDKTGGSWNSLGSLSLALSIEATPPSSTPLDAAVPPPPIQRCDAQNLDENSIVRASLPDAFSYGVHCRVLYQNGSSLRWSGGNLYGQASLGVPGLADLGIRQAVDIFSPSGLTYFQGGGVFCLRDEGTLIWLAASQSPRHAEVIGSYTVPEYPGFTCATLFEPGTLILVERNPARP